MLVGKKTEQENELATQEHMVIFIRFVEFALD